MLFVDELEVADVVKSESRLKAGDKNIYS